MRLKAIVVAFFIWSCSLFSGEERIEYPKFVSTERIIMDKVVSDLKCKESNNKIFTHGVDINRDGNSDVIALRYGNININLESNCEVLIYFSDKNGNLTKQSSFEALIALEEDGSQEELKITFGEYGNEITTDDYAFYESRNEYTLFTMLKPTIIDSSEHAYENSLMRFDNLLLKAEKGDLESQLKVGKKFHQDKNYDAALKWYQKIFKQGSIVAAPYITSVYYDKGDMVNYDKWVKKEITNQQAELLRIERENSFIETDDESVIFDYEVVLKCKNYFAAHDIAYYYDKLGEAKKAKVWYRVAAGCGVIESMYNLAIKYQNSGEIEKAIKWYKKSADGNFSKPMYALGLMYYYGKGVEKDYKEGVKWFNLGKNAENENCIGALGVAYFEGRGVKKDKNEAKKLWEIAAQKGDESAKRDLETLNEERVDKEKISFFEQKNGKYGILNGNFEWIISPKYEEPMFISYEKIVFKKNGKYGIMDEKENIIIKPIYDYIVAMEDRFCFGVADKNDNMKYGTKDYKEKILLNAQYKDFIYYENGLTCVSINGKYGYMDKNGKIVIPAKYDEYAMFENGIAVVSINKRYFVINEKGERITKELYDYLGYFVDQYAVAQKNGEFGLIDKRGNVVFPFQEERIEWYKKNCLIMQVGEKYIIKNLENEKVIDEQFDSAYFGEDDVIIVKKNELCGILNMEGNYIMELNNRFLGINSFIDGAAVAVENSGKIVRINKNGRILYEAE